MIAFKLEYAFGEPNAGTLTVFKKFTPVEGVKYYGDQQSTLDKTIKTLKRDWQGQIKETEEFVSVEIGGSDIMRYIESELGFE